MEKAVDHKKEIHDFMNVESFSQLPFIRPTQIKEKGIRLFGKEFEAHNPTKSASQETNTEDVKDNNGINNNNNNNNNNNKNNVDQSNRKFECHYCCRNFPTSQALGGHQNAHKRERQHAKRTHLQSSMLHGGGLPEAARVYGFLNYHDFGNSGPPTPLSPPSHLTYESWNRRHNHTNNTYARFYASNIDNRTNVSNGSALGVWTIPQVHNSAIRRNFSYPESNQIIKQVPSIMTTSTMSQHMMFGFESKNTTVGYNRPDNVSLDLRL